MDQREAFETYEGDEWFRRNLAVKQNYQAANDPIISLIRDYRIQPSSFLELGCSFGYRVNGIKQFFPRAEVQGVDASAEAVAYGKKQFPQIKLTQTGADDLSMFAAGSFDTLVVGFVFYVIDRDRLLKMCAEIDRVLLNHGYLIILDFNAHRMMRNKYEHITNFDAYSYKQNYEQVFLGTGMYQLLDKSSRVYADTMARYAGSDYANNLGLSLLKKDIYAPY